MLFGALVTESVFGKLESRTLFSMFFHIKHNDIISRMKKVILKSYAEICAEICALNIPFGLYLLCDSGGVFCVC